MLKRTKRAGIRERNPRQDRGGLIWLPIVLGLFTLVALVLAVNPRFVGAAAPIPGSMRLQSDVHTRPHAPGDPDTPTPTATATPSQPVLLGVDLDPTLTQPGGTLVLTYTLFSPGAQQVSLGAGVRVSGTNNFTYDPANDRTVSVNAGTNSVTRLFVLPPTGDVTYDVIWGLWSAGFGTQYGYQLRQNAVSVVGPTPTPAVPVLVSVGLGPEVAPLRSTVTFTYTVYTPYSTQVGLGADVSISGTVKFVGDPANDRVVSIPAGTTVITRPFVLTDTLGENAYWVRWGLWNSTFTYQYDIARAHPGLYIVGPTPTATATVTGTPPTNTPTYTPTFTRTPSDTPTATPTNTNTPTATNTPSFTATNTPTDTATNTNTPTSTSTSTFTATWTNTATNTPTDTPTNTATDTPTATDTATYTATPTDTATNTPTPTNTATATDTATDTPTSTYSPTSTPMDTSTPTFTATATDTATYTPTFTDTPTETHSPTSTPTFTHSPTHTPTATDTATPTQTASETPTATGTPTLTHTATYTPEPTHTPTFTSTAVPTETDTAVPTDTPTATNTDTATPAPIHTATATTVPTETATSTLVPTGTPTDTPSPTATTSVAVVGHVNWQGRPAQPNASQQVPMTLTLKMGTLELDYNIESTDRSGFFTVTVAGMPSGTYAWRIKGAQYLANAGIVQLTSDRSEQPNPSRLLAANIEAGMLKAGDANNDNLVNVFDFGIMRNSFGKTIGIPGYDPRADFTGDGIVNIFDFNLVKQNFGAMGAPPI